MVSKFQFKAVDELLTSGVDNYVLIRQQVGLTSEELDDILNNYEYYQSQFGVDSAVAEKPKQKKHWWNR